MPSINLRTKSTLVRQGIMLIAAPLLFQLFVFSGLLGLLHQAEQDASQAKHSKDIVDTADHIARDLFLQTQGMKFNKENPLETVKTSHAIYRRSREQLEDLRALVADNPEETAIVEKIARGVDDLENAMQEPKDLLRKKRYLEAFHSFRTQSSQAKDFMREAAFDLNTIVENERKAGEGKAGMEKSLRDRMQLLMLGALVLSGAVATAFTFVFFKKVVVRLRVVSENSERLANRKPLLEPVTGTDEIAELDRSFRAMSDKLAAAERTKQEFMSMVSHDLRSPLTSIATFIEALSEGVYGELNERATIACGRTETSCKRLLQMINELLEVERLESGTINLKFAPATTREICQAAIDTVADLSAAQGITVELDALSDTGLHCDASRLTQVITNLLANAIKFSPSNSTITVSAVITKDHAQFSVTDSGRGVPEHLRRAIFDRFAQVSEKDAENYKGTGLGLAICKAIVEEHGGSIRVEPNPSGGSIFTFEIPFIPSTLELIETR